MDTVFSILPKVLHKRGISAHANAALLLVHASRFLQEEAPEIAMALTPKKVEDGTLFIEAQHSIAAQEAQALLPRLLVHIGKVAPVPPIREIRLLRA